MITSIMILYIFFITTFIFCLSAIIYFFYTKSLTNFESSEVHTSGIKNIFANYMKDIFTEFKNMNRSMTKVENILVSIENPDKIIDEKLIQLIRIHDKLKDNCETIIYLVNEINRELQYTKLSKKTMIISLILSIITFIIYFFHVKIMWY